MIKPCRNTVPIYRKNTSRFGQTSICDGRIVPMKFKSDDGHVVVIDQILDVRQAPLLKIGR